MSECVKCGSTTLAEATQPKEHPCWCNACWDLLRDFDHKERHGVTLTVLRDLFAGLAMQQLMADFERDRRENEAQHLEAIMEPGDLIAEDAYYMADAMLAEREKKPEEIKREEAKADEPGELHRLRDAIEAIRIEASYSAGTGGSGILNAGWVLGVIADVRGQVR